MQFQRVIIIIMERMWNRMNHHIPLWSPSSSSAFEYSFSVHNVTHGDGKWRETVSVPHSLWNDADCDPSLLMTGECNQKDII